MSKEKIRGALGIILMISMMSVMQMLNPLKILLLGTLLILCFKSAKISKLNILFCSFLCISTFGGIIVGGIRGTEYPFYGITVGILWPIFSLFIVTSLLKTSKDYNIMTKYMFFMHIFLMLYDMLYAISTMRGVPIFNLYPEMKTIGFSYSETTSRLYFINLNTLTFTTPLFLLLYLTKYDFGVSKKIQFASLMLNLFFLIFCGRRSLMLIFVMAPIIAFVFLRFFPKNIYKKSIKHLSLLLIIIICFLYYFYVTMPELFESYLFTLTKAFDQGEESIRFSQAKMLYEHFLENPIVGSGGGTEFYEAERGIRNHQFELTYLLKLATLGIIGFSFYLLGTVGLLFIGIIYARKRNDVLFLCILYAFFFVLLADATNPVLCSFDLMLPLFLVYAKINSCVFNYDKVRVNERKDNKIYLDESL